MSSIQDTRSLGPTLRKQFDDQVRVVSGNIGELVVWSDDEMERLLKAFRNIELQFEGNVWLRAPKAKLRYLVAKLHKNLQCDHSEDIGPWAKWEPAVGSDDTTTVGKNALKRRPTDDANEAEAKKTRTGGQDF